MSKDDELRYVVVDKDLQHCTVRLIQELPGDFA